MVRPKARTRPIRPSSAPWTAPTGWWLGSGRSRSRRPTMVPTAAAPPTSTTSATVKTNVLHRKKKRSTSAAVWQAGDQTGGDDVLDRGPQRGRRRAGRGGGEQVPGRRGLRPRRRGRRRRAGDPGLL